MLSCIQEKIHRLQGKPQCLLTLCRQGVSWRTLPALSTTGLDLWAEDVSLVCSWGDYWKGQDTLSDMCKITLDTCLWSKGLTIMPFILTQGSGGPSTTFIQPSLCHHIPGQWHKCSTATAYVVCFEHDDGRLRDSPASSEGMLWAEDSLYKNIEQLSEGELGPRQPWTTAQHNHGAWGKFYELVKAHCFALCQVSLLLAVRMIHCRWYTADASGLAPVRRMALPFSAQQVDHYFLSNAQHLTQIWDTHEASCKLPMAKANKPFLALQWSSPTMCRPYLPISKGLLECTSALRGVEIALMGQALHGLSCTAGIFDLHHWDATLGLDGVGVWLIWHGNLSHVEDPISKTSGHRQWLQALFLFTHTWKVLCSNSRLKLLARADDFGPWTPAVQQEQGLENTLPYQMTIIKYLSVCIIIFLCPSLKTPEWRI